MMLKSSISSNKCAGSGIKCTSYRNAPDPSPFENEFNWIRMGAAPIRIHLKLPAGTHRCAWLTRASEVDE